MLGSPRAPLKLPLLPRTVSGITWRGQQQRAEGSYALKEHGQRQRGTLPRRHEHPSPVRDILHAEGKTGMERATPSSTKHSHWPPRPFASSDVHLRLHKTETRTTQRGCTHRTVQAISGGRVSVTDTMLSRRDLAVQHQGPLVTIHGNDATTTHVDLDATSECSDGCVATPKDASAFQMTCSEEQKEVVELLRSTQSQCGVQRPLKRTQSVPQGSFNPPPIKTQIPTRLLRTSADIGTWERHGSPPLLLPSPSQTAKHEMVLPEQTALRPLSETRVNSCQIPATFPLYNFPPSTTTTHRLRQRDQRSGAAAPETTVLSATKPQGYGKRSSSCAALECSDNENMPPEVQRPGPMLATVQSFKHPPCSLLCPLSSITSPATCHVAQRTHCRSTMDHGDHGPPLCLPSRAFGAQHGCCHCHRSKSVEPSLPLVPPLGGTTPLAIATYIQQFVHTALLSMEATEPQEPSQQAAMAFLTTVDRLLPHPLPSSTTGARHDPEKGFPETSTTSCNDPLTSSHSSDILSSLDSASPGCSARTVTATTGTAPTRFSRINVPRLLLRRCSTDDVETHHHHYHRYDRSLRRSSHQPTSAVASASLDIATVALSSPALSSATSSAPSKYTF